MIRPAVAADHDALAGLEESCFGAEAWGSAVLAEELSADRILLVADASTPAGYVDVAAVADTADLLRIAVVPAARRQGLARALLDAATERAMAAGADRMLAEVAEHNAPAIAFYAGAGFVEISRRRRYYRDGSDALVLQRSIGGPA